MKPLRVAIIHRDTPDAASYRQLYGLFSYEVPEFDWRYVPVNRTFTLDKDELAQDFDLIFYHDLKTWGGFTGEADIPVLYHVMDSTLSEKHYLARYQKAQEVADLILVDWDRLDRFDDLDIPVRRLAYAVNDRLFYDRDLPKEIDVSFFVRFHPSVERMRFDYYMMNHCQERGWVYESGIRTGERYARAFNQSKISIHLNRTPATRSPRIFDIMASNCCLLCDTQPTVSGDTHQAGVHYVAFDNLKDAFDQIDGLLESGAWEEYAEAGYEHVRERSAWSVRAKQLRAMVEQQFPQVSA